MFVESYKPMLGKNNYIRVIYVLDMNVLDINALHICLPYDLINL